MSTAIEPSESAADTNYASYAEGQDEAQEQQQRVDEEEDVYEDVGDCPPPEVPDAEELDAVPSARSSHGGNSAMINPALKIVIELPEAPPTPGEQLGAVKDEAIKSGVEARLEGMAWDYTLQQKDMSSDCNGVQRIYAKMLQSKTWW